ncbi:MAG: AlpA family phage regulatory protein [bacterium]|nr:AlpA family phage regulatory protein [bacterium]
MDSDNRLLRRPEVEDRCQLGTTSIYRLMRQGLFPEPIKVGPRAVRWQESEITAYLQGRPRASGMKAEGDRAA